MHPASSVAFAPESDAAGATLRNSGWEADERPEPRSLGLLPSGPDPVGEWLVHRQPPAAYIGRRRGESKRSRLRGFRPLDGCAERIVYRQLFPAGLTAFDPMDEATLAVRPTRQHLAAQQEARDLYACLQLPINDRSRRRAAARAEWFASATLPLEIDNLVID